jgi:hypothetical protein
MKIMKTICFFFVLLFFTVSAMAQTNFLNRSVSPHLRNNFLTWKNKQPITPAPLQHNIVKLPQDNMPCFVPDISSIAEMPTLKAPYQFIPNPYFKYNNSALSSANSMPR